MGASQLCRNAGEGRPDEPAEPAAVVSRRAPAGG